MIPVALLIFGLAILGFACRTFQAVILRKVGLLAFMASSYVLFYTISGSRLTGCLGIALWFCLPWVELLTRVRRMDFPIDRPLRRRVPPKEDFPFLDSACESIEEVEKFKHIDDWGYEWQGSEHFFRLFYDPETKTQATVCLTKDQTTAHAYVKLVSRDSDGQVYTTWNYPFSASLLQSPEHRLHWDRSSATFAGILETHLQFLERSVPSNELAAQDPSSFLEMLRKDQRRLVDHNLSRGLLKSSGEGSFRYTWRGLVFLWTQLLRDMVRLH